MRRSLLQNVAIAALIALVASSCGVFPDAQEQMVPMRDGIQLATDVYMPSHPEEGARLPVILMRTTYNKGAKNKGILIHSVMAKPYTDKGYVVVVQDTRGRNASAGVDSIYFNDMNDGYDTVEWITQQPWCDGNVGMIGMSALGITSYMAVASGHPALKCAYVVAAASSMYDDVFFPGGAYRMRMANSWVTGQGRAEFLPYIREHSSYGPEWDRVNVRANAPQAQAAVFHVSGWFDAMAQGQVEAFKALSDSGSVSARANQRLIMGAWSHGGAGSHQGELEYPANASALNPLSEAVPFFDKYLRGQSTALDTLPAVRYYLMGGLDGANGVGNRWLRSDTWPPAGISEVPYYLTGDSLLVASMPAQDRSEAYQYDPANPVPTVGGLNLYAPIGPADLRDSVIHRSDVLTFTTDTLTAPVVIAGKVKVRLWASSSAEDTDFNVLLSDVYHDGRSMLMMDGVVRARHRESTRTESFLTPGEPYEFEIDLWDSAIAFEVGHRIRISVTSSFAPKYEPNRNIRAALTEVGEPVVATNTIYWGPSHPSAVLLPVLPAESVEAAVITP